MLVCQYKVGLLKKKSGANDAWESTPIDITDMIDLSTRDGITVNADSFSLTLKNDNLDGINSNAKYIIGQTPEAGQVSLEIDDRVQVFSWYGFEEPSSFEDKFLFDGFINEFVYQSSDSGQKYYKVVGTNSSEVLLKQLIPAVYPINRNVNTAPLIIQEILNLVNSGSNGTPKNIYWHPDNPSVNSKGGSFKKINFFQKHKPAYMLISDLSTDDSTGDGEYYFFLKTEPGGSSTKTYLYWRKRLNTPTKTLTEGEDMTSYKITRGIWDTVNAVIVNCGKDANGSAIYTYYYDPLSYAKIGGKWKYIATDEGEKILGEEKINKPDSFTNDSNFPTSYPYTTHFSASKTDSGYTPPFTYNHHVVCNNDYEFNAAIRLEAKFRGINRGTKIVNEYGATRSKMDCELTTGTLDYVSGTVIKCQVDSYGWDSANTTNLRVTNVKHQLSSEGWITGLNLEEDWESEIEV